MVKRRSFFSPVIFSPPLQEHGSTSNQSGILGRILDSGDNDKQAATRNSDLERDIDTLCKEIASRKKEEEDYSHYEPSSSPCGPLLIFAAQLHQHGRTDLANKLTAEIFSLAPGRETVVDSAVSSLGNHFLNQATLAFYQRKNKIHENNK